MKGIWLNTNHAAEEEDDDDDAKQSNNKETLEQNVMFSSMPNLVVDRWTGAFFFYSTDLDDLVGCCRC